MKKFWNWIKNEESGIRTLRLDGVIASDAWFDDDVTPKMFQEDLNAGTGDIVVWISWPSLPNVIGGGNVIRTSVICFYLSNEGISIVENAVRIGLPVPRKLRAVLRHLRIKGEK